jgi:hypothetical protein
MLTDLKLPEKKLDLIVDGDATAEFVEYLIGRAEIQMTGMERGAERMDAVVTVLVDHLVTPNLWPKHYAHTVAQAVYSTVARRLDPAFRSKKEH